jgi:hypothetical protein
VIGRVFTRSAVLVVLLALASLAEAQSSGFGSIRGYISDEQQGRLAGVTLTVTNTELGTPRTTVSDGEGYYRLPELPPGTYRVTAEQSGFAALTRDEIVVRAGLNLELLFTMRLATEAQSIEVKGDTPMVESSTSVRTLNVSGEFQRALPLTTRQNWYDFMSMTPGMVTSGVDVGGFQSFFLNGSSNISHVIQLDGADVATSYRANPGFLVRMSSDSVGDVQIKTAALDASSPLGIGAMVNVVGQSGTNVLHGAGSWTFRPRRWTGSNSPGGTSAALSGSNVDLSLGGPIQRDHVWAYGTSRGHAYYLKLTGQRSPNQQVSFVTQNELYDESQDGSDYVAHLRNVDWGGPFTTVRLQSIWGSSLATSVTATYSTKSRSDSAVREDIPGVEVYSSVSPSGGGLSGVGRIALLDSVSFPSNNEPLNRTTIDLAATYYRSGLAGSHEIKTGLYFIPRGRTQAFTSNHAGGFPTVRAVLRDPANPAAGYIPFYRAIYDTVESTQTFVDARNLAFYLQDAWKPNARLTINAGVRVDYVFRRDRQFDTVVQDSTDVAPRLGANYALTEDGRNILRASLGKIHDNLTVNQIGAGSNTGGFRDEYDLDFNGTFETVFVNPARTAVFSDRTISDDYHQPYVWEWTVGYQRQFPWQTTVGANIMRRDYRDYAVATDTNGIYDGNVFLGYANPDFNQITLVEPNRYYRPVYTALDLQVSKETSRIQLLASYVRQWRHMTGTWAPRDPASFIQPDAFPNDRGIGSTGPSVSSAGVNSLTGSAYTGFQGWRDHVVRAAAAVQAPWGLQLATLYTFQSGVWSGPVVQRLAAADPAFGPATVVLSNGRRVGNPLSTVVRFAYPTAGEGQFASDGVHTWNVRVGRQFSWAQWRLEPSLDVLNVVNAGAFQQFMSGANDRSSANFGRQNNIQVPRTAMFSLRLSH